MRIHNGHVLGAAALIVPPAAVFVPLGTTALLALTAVAALAVLWRDGRLAALRPGACGWLLIAFTGWAFASLIWTTDATVTLDKAPRLAAEFAAGLVAIAAARALDKTERAVFGRLVVAGAVAALALLLIELITAGGLVNLSGRQFEAANDVFTTYNRGLTLLALTVWAAFPPLMRRDRRLGWTLLAAALVVFGVHTSGGALAGFVFGLIAFGVAHVAPRRAPLLAGAVAALYIVASPAIHAWWLSPHILGIEGHRSIQDNTRYWYFPRSSYHRVLIWHFSAARALEKPLLGWGFRTSRVIPGGKSQLDTSEQALPLHPHNGVLQIWLELGVLGALMAVAFVIALARRIRLYPIGGRAPETAIALFTTGFTIVCVSYGLWQSWWMASLFFGAAFCVAAIGPTTPDNAPR